MSQGGNSAEVRNYIREKIRAGKFLIKSLHQRQQTILNIAREIVKRQHDFMDKGVSLLKPLTMVQVAEVVGVHETTVSRAVSGKYMDTPQGIFEMKYFFTAGIQTASGSGMSNTSVKEMIAEIFKKEDPTKPLVRPGSCQDAQGKRHRHRPPHRCQIPHGTEYPALESEEGLLRPRRRSNVEGIRREEKAIPSGVLTAPRLTPAPRISWKDGRQGNDVKGMSLCPCFYSPADHSLSSSVTAPCPCALFF